MRRERGGDYLGSNGVRRCISWRKIRVIKWQRKVTFFTLVVWGFGVVSFAMAEVKEISRRRILLEVGWEAPYIEHGFYILGSKWLVWVYLVQGMGRTWLGLLVERGQDRN
jgi:hypothetical protein